MTPLSQRMVKNIAVRGLDRREYFAVIVMPF